MRVSRQWRHIQLLMENGYGHDTTESPGNGDLAIFCPACPQPGVNIPANWRDDSNQYVNFSELYSS